MFPKTPDGLEVLITRPRTSSPAFASSRQCAAAWRVGAKWPLRWTVIDRVPLLLGHVHEHPVAQDPRVVDEDVEAAERRRAPAAPSGRRRRSRRRSRRSRRPRRRPRGSPRRPARRASGRRLRRRAAAPRSLTTTFAPAAASASACARPIPRPAPVTIATFPSRFGMRGRIRAWTSRSRRNRSSSARRRASSAPARSSRTPASGTAASGWTRGSSRSSPTSASSAAACPRSTAAWGSTRSRTAS